MAINIILAHQNIKLAKKLKEQALTNSKNLFNSTYEKCREYLRGFSDGIDFINLYTDQNNSEDNTNSNSNESN